MTLSGKNAVITGSTSGIGLGIAKGFAQSGINVMVNGLIEPGAAQTILNDLRALNVKAEYHGADMTKPSEIADLIAQAERTFGSVDILVNNAGIQTVQPVEDFPPAQWEKIIAVNLQSSFHTVRAALPGMKRQGWGRIINIASAHALVASPFKSAYVAAKHGLLGFTKTVALEAAQNGVTCNAICPGYVWTKLVENQVKDTAKARNMSEQDVIEKILLAAQWTKKFVTPEQIAGIALFLCTPPADNITGIALPVDGGWTAA